MSDIGTVLEQPSQANIFHNEGHYTVIEGTNVETGEYFVDTRSAKQTGDELEWESMFRLKPDSKLFRQEDDLSYAYTSVGEVLRLWEYAKDPHGTQAKQVHKKIVELAQRGVPLEELLGEVRDVIIDLQAAL